MIIIRQNRQRVESKQKPGEMDPEVLRAMADDAKEFAPRARTLSDTGFWLDEPDVPWENPYWDWFSANEALDRRGDKEPLRKMLREFCAEKDPTVGLLIDDMFARYNFVHVPGKPRVPIYDISEREQRLLSAIQRVHRHMRDGMKREKAIKRVADEYRILEQTVRNAVDGGRGSLNRTLERLELLKSYWLARVPAELRLRPTSRR